VSVTPSYGHCHVLAMYPSCNKRKSTMKMQLITYHWPCASGGRYRQGYS